MQNTLTIEQIEIIRNHAALAAYALAHGAPSYACDVQPGNGTRYLLLITSLEQTHGNPSQIGGRDDHYVLSLPYFQTSYPFNMPGYFADDYAASKWTGRNEADGQVIAEFLNYLSVTIEAAQASIDD